MVWWALRPARRVWAVGPWIFLSWLWGRGPHRPAVGTPSFEPNDRGQQGETVDRPPKSPDQTRHSPCAPWWWAQLSCRDSQGQPVVGGVGCPVRPVASRLVRVGGLILATGGFSQCSAGQHSRATAGPTFDKHLDRRGGAGGAARATRSSREGVVRLWSGTPHHRPAAPPRLARGRVPEVACGTSADTYRCRGRRGAP